MIEIRNFTVKELKEKIKDLPDDMPVAYERIHDKYFNEMGWTTVPLLTELFRTGDKDTNGNDIYEPIYGEFIYVFTGHTIDDKFVLTAHY